MANVEESDATADDTLKVAVVVAQSTEDASEEAEGSNELEATFAAAAVNKDGKVTAMALDKGRKNNILLKQPQYQPLPVGEQVALLYCGTRGLLKDLNLDQVEDFQMTFLQKMRAFHVDDVLDPLSAGNTDPEIFAIIEKECASIVKGLTI